MSGKFARFVSLTLVLVLVLAFAASTITAQEGKKILIDAGESLGIYP